MRALLPHPADSVDLVEAYALPPVVGSDQPFLRCNMISTLDGAITINGRSGAIGGPADRRLFQVLRALTDVVLVGAGTVRAEHYGPVRLDDELRGLRKQRGQSAVPPVAIVTRSGNLDWSARLFTAAEERPIVFVTEECDATTRRHGEKVADLVEAGTDRVDPTRVLDHLGRLGLASVLLEGGPGLNADFVQAGLLDELCLTLAPRLVGGDGPHVLAGGELAHPLEFELVHLLEEDGFLFHRMTVRR
jgi:riboflavin-specific deaminase-like protein